MATLWDKLTKKKAPEVIVENTIYNPFGVRVNDSVKINTIDLEKENLVFNAIRQVKRTINRVEHSFADYDLGPQRDQPLRIRLVPMENPDSKLTHDVLLLAKVGECVYNKEFHEGLAFEANEGVFEEGETKYWRVNDQQEPWLAKTVTLQDLDLSGKIDINEATKGSLTYWDFWRETEGEGGDKVIEFYIVEMDQDGYFTFWVGQQIDPLRIVI
jgi:hypothetical protein